jgi:hypothetical protein
LLEQHLVRDRFRFDPPHAAGYQAVVEHTYLNLDTRRSSQPQRRVRHDS